MDTQKLLLLLKYILNKQPLSECPVVSQDWKDLLAQAKQHNVVSMLGCVLPQLTAAQMPPQKELDSLRRQAMLMALVNSNQLHGLEQMQQAFEAQGIWHMPLKGSTTRHLYPQPEMRTMNDLDILTKPSQQKEIRKIMTALGYADFKEGRKHDIYCKKPYIRIEMHREMVAARSRFSKYYRNVWDRCQPEEGKKYACRMSATDAFVFNLVHLAGHLDEGGVGIRFITDVYVFDRCDAVDKAALQNTLEELGLWELYKNVSCLAQQWFSMDPPVLEQAQAKLMQRLGEFVLSGGLFGTADNSSALAVHNDGRIGHFLKACFPGYEEMRSMYPWLEKWRILLPWSWFLRGTRSLLFRRESIKGQFRTSVSGDVQKGDALHRLYRDIGYYE